MRPAALHIDLDAIRYNVRFIQQLIGPGVRQAAIVKAGKEAAAYGRQVESGEDSAKVDALEKAGKLKKIPFADRAAMKKLVDPVIEAYAKEIGADQILAKINALK